MAYLNDSLTIVGEDSESGFDQIHTDFLQHFNNDIRISNMGGSNEKDAATAEAENPSTPDHDGKSCDQISANITHRSQKALVEGKVNTSVPQSDESKLFDAGGGGGGIGGDEGVNNSNGSYVSGAASSGSAGGNSSMFGFMTTSKPESLEEGSSLATLSAGGKGRPSWKHGSAGKVYRKAKDPPLNASFPSKVGSCELKILKQPEEQHRARYLTEGSRGTVKDQTGQGHPTLKLCGYDQPIPLQVFVGTDAGRMKPHGFYQACKVSNKNSTACVERDIEGTTVIEVMFDPKQEMVAVVDCVGILKLRNADVELRIGLAKSKKKSTCARLIFRVNIPKPDGTFFTLQTASCPIICTQPTGAPEISKKSISHCSVKGGEELFIIGKNFTKGTVVYFEEVKNDQAVWSKEADIDQDFFQSTHLVCTVPSYRSLDVRHPIQVQIVVHSSGRISDPVSFCYHPNVKSAMLTSADASIPMETESAAVSKSAMQEIGGLKRPYESSPHPDANYFRSPEIMSNNDVSHILGLGAAEFREVREESFTDSKIVQHTTDPGQSLSAQTLFETACARDTLTKSQQSDSFILPLQAVDTNNPGPPPAGSLPCFPDSKENVPFAGVFGNLYDSPVSSNLAAKVLSQTHSQRDLELMADHMSDLLGAAHQSAMSSLPHENVLQTNGAGRASLPEQIGVVQSPTDHVVPLLDAVPVGPMECGEPHSKRLAACQDARMDLLMHLFQADGDGEKLKSKDEMNWLPGGSPSYNLNANSNIMPLTSSESHNSCHSANPSQIENLSNFSLKNFEPVQPSSSSVQTSPPVVFSFDHDVMQSSFLHSQTPEVKPDPSFTVIDDMLRSSIQYTNSSGPQSMDTSCPTGVFNDSSHAGLSFNVPSSVDLETDNPSLFGNRLQADPPKDPPVAVGSFQTHSRNSLPGTPSGDGNSILDGGSNQVHHMISIRRDSSDVVGMEFRSIEQSGFEAMKTSCTDLHDILNGHLTSDAHIIADMNPITGQNIMLNHHSNVNDSEAELHGVSQMSDHEHRLSHMKQNFHGFSGQDQALAGQQMFSHSTHVELTPSFGNGSKVSEYIQMDLPELDALMCVGNPRLTASSSMTSLNDLQMPGGALNQDPIEITPGNHLAELDRNSSSGNSSCSHIAPVLNLNGMNPLGGVVCTDVGGPSPDDGSMQSNLQQSLSELHDLKQQMGFTEPQSPTQNGKSSATQADVGTAQENKHLPGAVFGISNEQQDLATSADSVLLLLSEQNSLQSLSNCGAGSFRGSDIADIRPSVDCPQMSGAGQSLDSTASLEEMLYNFIQEFAAKGENLDLQIDSSSSAPLTSEPNGKVNRLSSTASHILTSGNDSCYIGTDNGISSETKTLQQPVAQSILSHPNSIPNVLPLHNQTSPVNVLLQMQDGRQVMVPLSSIVGPPSTKPAMAKHNSAAQSDGSIRTNVMPMDYKPVVAATVVPSSKVICLPPNVVSALTGKVESGLSGKSLFLVSTGSLNQLRSSALQMPNERHLSSNISSSHSALIDSLYSVYVSAGSTGNMKFVSSSTAVQPHPIISILPAQARQDHQPMDTSSPFNHFTHEAPGSAAEPQQQQPHEQQQQQINSKIPTLLYQLLTTDSNSGALRDTVTATTMTSLPNLSVDDVSRVLEMNHTDHGLR